MNRERVDVVIIGAGKAGLSLARQLLLRGGKTILLIDRRADPPGPNQKVGESLVQLSGYYFTKVLELEEHLLTNHFLKYNLRFHWRTPDLSNTALEDHSVSFIRLGSNIPTFQLDRNVLERHLLEVNRADPAFEFLGGAKTIDVQLAPEGSPDDHVVAVNGREVRCRWVVDSSGRGGVLKRMLDLGRESPIRHGSTWCWVEGVVDIERLTRRSNAERRVDPERRKTGHMPFFLATNHFCDEGMWFWVIPLHGKTSLGLVFDHAVLHPEEVSSGRKMLDYVCGKWPIFAQDFSQRKVLDEGRYFDYAFDAKQTISDRRWALTGEAGRFSDPLYSPGGDLIAIYNTLIADAIHTEDPTALAEKCAFYESVMRVVYEAYVPSYSVSYNCLGDQEAFTLKYTWELAVYFTFYVVPGISDLFTDRKAMLAHFRKFALLGPINLALQKFLSDFARWKKSSGDAGAERRVIDFYQLCPLRESEKLFYRVALSQKEVEDAFDMQFARLKEFARYIAVHVYASVLSDRRVLTNAPFIASVKLRTLAFDPERMREQYEPFAASEEVHMWNLNPFALEEFVKEATMKKEVPA